MNRNFFRLGAGVLGAALMLPGAAVAGHFGHGSSTTVTTTIIHGSAQGRGGPPAHARAHGYRHQHARRGHAGPSYRQPVVIYHAPVHVVPVYPVAPVYRAPPRVYHAPHGGGTLDLSIYYRTRF